MSAARILWGQVLIVLTIVFAMTWAATEWTAWRLGFQPELGRPWFELAHGSAEDSVALQPLARIDEPHCLA